MDAINKAFEILDIFLEKEEELGINDIVRLINIKASTAHRITNILVSRGYIYQKQKRGKYSLSTKKLLDFVWIAKARLKVRNVALPFLQDLSQVVNENAHINFKVGKIAYNTDVITSNNHTLSVMPEKRDLDLYSTSVGKVFLAYMPDTEFQEYCNDTVLKAKTPNTITELSNLKMCLKKVRREGVAFDDEENELGVKDIASPIKDLDGTVVAAIGVIGPSVRITRRRMIEISRIVKKYAQDISEAMGYSKKRHK